MGRQIEVGNPPITVELRRSSRARRLSLRISRLDGKATLTMPNGARESLAVDFLNEREGWMRKTLATVQPMKQLRVGGTIPFQGRELTIRGHAAKRAKVVGDDIFVPESDDGVGAKIKALFRLKARDALAEASDRYAQDLGKTYDRLSLRDTRSRWGSCSSKGVLMYSWRLIMAPVDVLDYVAAHEVSHLVEMNHSRAFWNTVGSLMPDYEVHRRWLKQEGAALHRISFED